MKFIIRFCFSQVFIQSLMRLNRAVNEDIVAVQILPKSQWTCPSSVVTLTVAENDDDEEEEDENEETEV